MLPPLNGMHQPHLGCKPFGADSRGRLSLQVGWDLFVHCRRWNPCVPFVAGGPRPSPTGIDINVRMLHRDEGGCESPAQSSRTNPTSAQSHSFLSTPPLRVCGRCNPPQPNQRGRQMHCICRPPKRFVELFCCFLVKDFVAKERKITGTNSFLQSAGCRCGR